MRSRSVTQEASSDSWVTVDVFRKEPPCEPLLTRQVWEPRQQLAWAYSTIVPLLDSIAFIRSKDMNLKQINGDRHFIFLLRTIFIHLEQISLQWPILFEPVADWEVYCWRSTLSSCHCLRVEHKWSKTLQWRCNWPCSLYRDWLLYGNNLLKHYNFSIYLF